MKYRKDGLQDREKERKRKQEFANAETISWYCCSPCASRAERFSRHFWLPISASVQGLTNAQMRAPAGWGARLARVLLAESRSCRLSGQGWGLSNEARVQPWFGAQKGSNLCCCREMTWHISLAPVGQPQENPSHAQQPRSSLSGCSSPLPSLEQLCLLPARFSGGAYLRVRPGGSCHI